MSSVCSLVVTCAWFLCRLEDQGASLAYEFIGECHAPGLMHGEAVSTLAVGGEERYF